MRAIHKLFISTLVLWHIGTLPLHAQEHKDNLGIVFRVQVAASTTPLPETSQLFKDMPDVEGVKFPDGFIRYMSGSFESLYAAEQRLDEIKKKGYKDAYVTALQGTKRYTADEAIDLIYNSK